MEEKMSELILKVLLVIVVLPSMALASYDFNKAKTFEGTLLVKPKLSDQSKTISSIFDVVERYKSKLPELIKTSKVIVTMSNRLKKTSEIEDAEILLRKLMILAQNEKPKLYFDSGFSDYMSELNANALGKIDQLNKNSDNKLFYELVLNSANDLNNYLAQLIDTIEIELMLNESENNLTVFYYSIQNGFNSILATKYYDNYLGNLQEMNENVD